jgi:hypothetical protein
MPTFHTPEPISVTIDLAIAVGDVRIVASERTDTVVEVYPSDASSRSDIKAAEQVLVDYTDGTLLVKASKPWYDQYSLFDHGGAVAVKVELPAGSHVRGQAAQGGFRCAGRLGECRFKTYYGDIRLDETGPLHLATGSGEISVDHVAGSAEVTTGSGKVRLREIDGAAVIKNSNGDSQLGTIIGNLHINSANGDIDVAEAHAGVEAKTANGSIRIAQIIRGSVVVETASGEVEIGICEGTSAWLDVSSVSGTVHNSLDATDGPDQFDATVEMHARTYDGDILIHRA